jgi:hypothetical protein
MKLKKKMNRSKSLSKVLNSYEIASDLKIILQIEMFDVIAVDLYILTFSGIFSGLVFLDEMFYESKVKP